MAENKTTYNLVPQTLKKGLYTQIVGSRILHFKELDSTMDRAAEEAERGTAGNLILSVVLRPTLEALPFISVLAALAVTRTIETETRLDPVIKWPNDVLIRGRKICGLLVENSLQGKNVRHSIVGIGLNVELDPGESPEIAQTATSLRLETGRATDVSVLLLRLLHELDELYVSLRNGQSPVPRWSGYLETIGKRVQVQWGEEIVTGTAEGVDDMGHLLLRRDNGALLTLTAGEVTLNTTLPHAITSPHVILRRPRDEESGGAGHSSRLQEPIEGQGSSGTLSTIPQKPPTPHSRAGGNPIPAHHRRINAG